MTQNAAPPAAAPAQPLPVPPIPLEPVAALQSPVTAPTPVTKPAPAPIAAADAPSLQARATPPTLVTPPGLLPSPGPRAALNGHSAQHPRPNPRPVADGGSGPEHHDDEPAERGATGPQLRRFIKSRAYVPMHELRRRFVINGGDDEVTPVDLGERRRVFVGLPEREGRLLGELLRGGDIGYELSLDPVSPIVVGIYPMRPVTRA